VHSAIEMVGLGVTVQDRSGGPTSPCGPASARQPSCLNNRQLGGVTALQFATRFFERHARQPPRRRDDPQFDSDVTAHVRRVFEALSSAAARSRSRLQIVLIDHVGESEWHDMKDVHLVERWREGNALIPSHWLT
jgi:hypothetical protein